MFLPRMVLMPQKFAIRFTLICIFIIESFFALKGPKNRLRTCHRKRLPFTLGFIATMVGTGYMSKVLRSYLLSLLFFFYRYPTPYLPISNYFVSALLLLAYLID
ncbi:hypothetical protein MKW92_021495 [Papaver armeniacum]|nr:hypothetical protein MKW92_021495 [Papaver armeniacum]